MNSTVLRNICKWVSCCKLFSNLKKTITLLFFIWISASLYPVLGILDGHWHKSIFHLPICIIVGYCSIKFYNIRRIDGLRVRFLFRRFWFWFPTWYVNVDLWRMPCPFFGSELCVSACSCHHSCCCPFIGSSSSCLMGALTSKISLPCKGICSTITGVICYSNVIVLYWCKNWGIARNSYYYISLYRLLLPSLLVYSAYKLSKAIYLIVLTNYCQKQFSFIHFTYFLIE